MNKKFSDAECDKIIKYCVEHGNAGLDGNNLGYSDPKQWDRVADYMRLMGYIEPTTINNGGFRLTNYGREIAEQGGLVEREARRERDLRKADDLLASSMQTNQSVRDTNDSTKQANTAVVESVAISGRVADSTIRTNYFIWITAIIAGVGLYFQIRNLNLLKDQVILQQQQLQQDSLSQVSQAQLKELWHLASFQRDSIASLSVENLSLRLSLDSALLKIKNNSRTNTSRNK